MQIVILCDVRLERGWFRYTVIGTPPTLSCLSLECIREGQIDHQKSLFAKKNRLVKARNRLFKTNLRSLGRCTPHEKSCIKHFDQASTHLGIFCHKNTFFVTETFLGVQETRTPPPLRKTFYRQSISHTSLDASPVLYGKIVSLRVGAVQFLAKLYPMYRRDFSLSISHNTLVRYQSCFQNALLILFQFLSYSGPIIESLVTHSLTHSLTHYFSFSKLE